MYTKDKAKKIHTKYWIGMLVSARERKNWTDIEKLILKTVLGQLS